MNIFRLAGDMTHLLSILVLLLKIYATKSCSGHKLPFIFPNSQFHLLFNSPLSLTDVDFFFSFSGISRKTQELYAIVFLARYLDLFTDFISVYNTFMKVVFIASSLAIVWCMRVHPMVRRSYDKEIDTFRYYFLIAASFVLALVLHEKFTFQEVPFFL